MNPNFAQETTADQYLAYDSWLYQERLRNWSAYTAYCEYKQQQQTTYARIQQLRYQYQQQQEQLRQQLIQQQYQQQQQQKQQKQQEQLQAEADFQSYIKEIDEIRTELPQESVTPAPATYVSTTPEADCWDIPEKFQPTQEKKWRKDLRQDRRRDSKHVVEYYKQVRDGIPPAPEVSRAEYFNANKPPRMLRYESAQKRKTKARKDQRTYGSGWAKQQLE